MCNVLKLIKKILIKIGSKSISVGVMRYLMYRSTIYSKSDVVLNELIQ